MIAYDSARNIVDLWVGDHSFGPTSVDLHPVARAALVKRIASAIEGTRELYAHAALKVQRSAGPPRKK